MASEKKLSNSEFIASHVKFRKNVMGWWEASFVCADGYQFSCSDSRTGRTVKNELKDRIVRTVMAQTQHPIQKS